MAPLTDLWDFTASSPKVPSDRDIQRAASLVNYKDITFSQNRLYFNKENMGIDAGAIAKGFIADKIKEYLVSKGVKSAIINLGGNVPVSYTHLDVYKRQQGPLAKPWAEPAAVTPAPGRKSLTC